MWYGQLGPFEAERTLPPLFTSQMSKRTLPTADPDTIWSTLSNEEKVELLKRRRVEQTSALVCMPPEIFALVMENFSNYRTYVRMMGVCRQFRGLIQKNELQYAPDVNSRLKKDVDWYVDRFIFRARMHRGVYLSRVPNKIAAANSRYGKLQNKNTTAEIEYCMYTKIIVTKTHAVAGKLNLPQPELCIDLISQATRRYSDDPGYLHKLKNELTCAPQSKFFIPSQ